MSKLLPKSGRRWAVAAGAVAVAGALLATVVAIPAQATTPVLTTSIEAVTDSVQSGGQLTYRVTYQTSNLTTDKAIAPTFTLPRPTGTDVNGQPVVATGTPVVRGNADLASSTGADPLTVVLKDLTPGTTGEFTVGWTVPNYTTLPGTTFPGDVSVKYGDGSGASSDQLTASATTPSPITTTAQAALNVVKQTITPANEALVIPDQPVTYNIYACNPTVPTVGALDYKDLTIVDTLPKGAQYVSSTGGGVYDPAAETVTWPKNASPARNSCNSPSETYQVTVIYPSATFVPAPADPQGVNTFVNTVHATATGIDGTPLEADGKQTHTFQGPPLTGGSGNTYYYQKNVDGNVLANTNTTAVTKWSTVFGWWESANPVTDATKLRTFSLVDRMPCLANGVAQSPLYTDTDPLATEFPGTIAIPADQCKTPAVDLKSVEGYGADHTVEIQFVTWDGSTARVHVVKASDLGKSGWIYIHAGDTGYNAGNGDYSLGLPLNELVTDMRVVGKNLVHGPGAGTGIAYRTTTTKAFADSGLLAVTNTLHQTYGGTTYAPGATIPVSAANGGADRSATKTYYHTQPDPQVSKRALTSVNALKPGDKATWQLSISNGLNGNIALNPVLVDVLPVGLDYIDGSDSWTNLDKVGNPTLTKSTIQINGQDRTKLTWTWPAGTKLNNGDPSPTVKFDTKVTLAATSGAHTGDDAQTAVLFDANGPLTVPAGSNMPTDKWDLNGNGNTDEGVGMSTAGWTVLPSSGATIEKWVKGALDADWNKDGLTNATYDGSNSQVDYRLAITNPNTLSLKDLVVYDVLPHVGDTAIGKDLAGEKRGTQWNVLFDKVTSLPAGATVEYSTSDNPCRPELFGGTAGQKQPSGCDDNWTSTVPSDPTTVKSLKFDISQVDPSTDPTMIEYRTQAPKLTGEKDLAFTDPSARANNNVAWHTFRVTAAGEVESLPAAEAPVVSVRRAAGMIGDYVWEDTNRDGIQDAGEPGIPGVTVNLLDKDGKPVLDADGKPITTVTDKDGKYSFVVPLGEWSVSFTNVPSQYEPTTPKAGGDDAKDSDLTAIGTPTHTVTVTDPVRNGEGSNVNLNLDAGLVLAKLSITKDDGKTIVKPGEETTYTITVTNNATAAEAKDFTVNDLMPAELEYVSSSNNGAYDADKNSVEWSIASLAAGKSTSVTVTAKVKDGVKPDTTIVNVANVIGPGCTEPNDCETTDVDNTPPQVSIVKDDHKTVVGLGEELTYDLTVKNLSTKSDATEVVVTDALPEQLEYVSSTDDGVYDADAHTVTWQLGTLAQGAERVIHVTAKVAQTTPAGDTITNNAKVETAEGCTEPNDCTTVDIDHTPDISIVKDDHKTVVEHGEQLDYDVVVSNNAEWAATGVIAVDTLPSNVDYVSSTDGGIYDAAKRTVTWKLAELAGNASKTFQVSVKVNDSAKDNDRIVNNATVTTDQGCFDADKCKTQDIDTVNPADAILPPGEILARTGSNLSTIAIWVGGILVALGGVLLVVRRRRNHAEG